MEETDWSEVQIKYNGIKNVPTALPSMRRCNACADCLSYGSQENGYEEESPQKCRDED